MKQDVEIVLIVVGASATKKVGIITKKKVQKEILKIKIDPTKRKIENIHGHLQAMNQGTGIQKPKKEKARIIEEKIKNLMMNTKT